MSRWRCAIAVAMAALVGYLVGARGGADHEVMRVEAPGGQRAAFVRERPCDGGRCQALWMAGPDTEGAALATLPPGERCEEIAWAADGRRVGFVIDGYQLRIFDGDTGEPRGQVNLVEPSGSPTTRIARGVTFSSNGAAVTYDDCPRRTSGCRSALAAIR